MVTTAKQVNEHTRQSFVRRKVVTDPLSDYVIDAIMPYYPKSVQVIGAFVDASNQYWKTNWHWEFLLNRLKLFQTMDIEKKYRDCAKAIESVLTKSTPNPAAGYLKSAMGIPKDKSSRAEITKRWAVVRQSKKDFRRVLNGSKVLDGMEVKTKKTWLLSVAPIARPGRSKHSTGYAIDLYGKNAEIIEISKKLGASLVYPEGSHVHVEFAKGVAGKPLPSAHKAPTLEVVPQSIVYGDDMCMMSPYEYAALKEDARNAPALDNFSETGGVLRSLVNILDDTLGEDWW